MRNDLELQTEQLRSNVAAMAQRGDAMLDRALRAFSDGDLAAAEAAIGADDEVDRAYEQIQHGVLAIVALHAPVGHDLRLLTGLIHVSLHLERMADYAVNTARAAIAVAEFASDVDLTEQIVEMGSIARDVGSTAVRSFLSEDPDLARRVAELDDGVDRYDRGIFQRLVRLGGSDDTQLDWAGRMIRVARHLERYADHGVDIAEQTIFVVTGEAVGLGGRQAL
jgi:phosphate transport system protein